MGDPLSSQIRTAVIFDRDHTLIDSFRTSERMDKNLESPVVYFDGVVDAVLKIRESHVCAIATTGNDAFSLPGLDECFKGHYYVKHLITSGESYRKGMDGEEEQEFLWYIDPKTGLPENRYEVFHETFKNNVQEELDRMEQEIETLRGECKQQRTSLYEREDVVAIKKEFDDLADAGSDFDKKRSFLSSGISNCMAEDPRIQLLLEFTDFDDLDKLRAICERMNEIISERVIVPLEVDKALRRIQNENTYKIHELRGRLKELEQADGLEAKHKEWEELMGRYYDAKSAATSWLEDLDGRRFDETWVYKNPKTIAMGTAGLRKDLGLVRRWIAGPEVDSLRTVMVGDDFEFQVMLSHPVTPLILPYGNAWVKMPEVIDFFLKSSGPSPDQIFDELHERSQPSAGTWDGRSEAEYKKSNQVVMPMTGRVKLAGCVWLITQTRHIIRHRSTREETEFVTRSLALASDL